SDKRALKFLRLYGITQEPETEDYMIVVQYANNGSLLSFLDQNIHKLTWKMKLEYLGDIAYYLRNIHGAKFVHCDLHGESVLMHSRNESGTENDLAPSNPFVDLSLSRSVNSRQSTIQGALPFIAPEVFHTRQFTKESDIYSFGLIMYLMATGEPPFRDRQVDTSLICDIMGGLRP